MKKHFLGTVVAMTAVMATLPGPAAALEERTLKLSHVFPSTHWLMTEGIQGYIDKVSEASGGKITFELYHGGQLGKETTALVNSGLVDMGLANPSYEPEKLPLTGVIELPGMHSTACEGNRQYWEMAKEGGMLFEEEYKKLGIRPLMVIALAPYEVQTKTVPVQSVADMKGLKLRANGAMGKAVAALEGVPVQISSNEFYDALSRGTIDGGVWLTGSTRAAGLERELNHTVKGVSMGAGAPLIFISERVYQDLDEETQQILTRAGIEMNEEICAFIDNREAEVETWLTDNDMLTLHDLPEAEVSEWVEKIQPVLQEWATEMDSSGRAGSKVLEAYRSIAEATD